MNSLGIIGRLAYPLGCLWLFLNVVGLEKTSNFPALFYILINFPIHFLCRILIYYYLVSLFNSTLGRVMGYAKVSVWSIIYLFRVALMRQCKNYTTTNNPYPTYSNKSYPYFNMKLKCKKCYIFVCPYYFLIYHWKYFILSFYLVKLLVTVIHDSVMSKSWVEKIYQLKHPIQRAII